MLSVNQHKTKFAIFAAVLSGLLLGISEPLYMPLLFGEIGNNQSWFGLLAFIGYVPLFNVIAKRNLKSTFLLTFLAMTIQYTIVLYWIYIALHDYGDITPIIAAIITLLLPMLLALKGALFFTMGRFLSMRWNVSFFLFAPFALCAGEYFRNYYIFGGFPWGNAGYSISRIDEFLQIASLVGIYGLVFFVGLINALICIALKNRHNKNAYLYLSAIMSIIIVAFAYGALRLNGIEREFAPLVRVALLQGNIPQEIKSHSRLHAQSILNIYLNLQRQAKAEGADLVIWPESAYPSMLPEDIKDLGFSFADRIASIIGASVYGENPDKKSYYAHNSALLIDYEGKVVRRYDKSHLVPFGEYVPWPMNGMVDKIVPGIGAFRPGTELVPEELAIKLGKTISLGITICYEGIFPEITRRLAQKGASLLVNLTNDAWYGFSSAPYQHLLMYKVRSAETGLPFVRATNTGISAWIDSYGRAHQSSNLFERVMIIGDVPLLKEPTIYVIVGDVIPIISLLLLIIGYVFAVLPVHRFIIERKWGKLVIFLSLSAIAIFSYIYYSSNRFLTDESARTKSLLIILSIFMLMIGLLSKSKRSRSVLFAVSVIFVFCSAALAIFESVYFLIGLIFGLLIYLLAFRMREGDKPVQ